jgi:hypothetical protein
MLMSESLTERMLVWFRGNTEATQLALDIWAVAQVWDDLYDQDRNVERDEITGSLRRLVYTIPTNPFYAAHAHELAPLMHDMMLRWQIANTLETEQREAGDIAKAWMLRAGIYQVFVYIASLAVDPLWASVVGAEIWRTYGETLEDFVEETKDA